MESYAKATNTKRFVIEDTFTKVTSDGEPHGMMTMIAGISGLLAAVVILAILVSLVGFKKNRKSIHARNTSASIISGQSCARQSSTSTDEGINSKRFSILSLFHRGSNIAKDTLNEDMDARPRLVSVSCITNGNFEGNLNTAFLGSELNLGGSLRKKQKVLADLSSRSQANLVAKETIIDMEKY